MTSATTSESLPRDLFAQDERLRRWKWMLSIGVCCIAALGLAIETWGANVKYRFVAKRWGVVVPNALYRSGQISKWMLEKQIQEHQIGAIIDMNGIEPTDEHQCFEIEFAKRTKLPLYRFSMRGDGTGDITRHADAIETIERCRREKTPVLVHCSAGAQRTGGVVAMYRVLVQGWTTEKAREEMIRYDWKPSRDQELIPFLNDNMRTLATLLVERGVIDRVPEPLPKFRQ